MPETVAIHKNNKTKAIALILFGIAIIYDLSPVDIIPDVPLIGWIDDIIITVAAGLNLIEKGMGGINTSAERIVRFVKWVVLAVGIITVTLLGCAAYGVIKLISV